MLIAEHLLEFADCFFALFQVRNISCDHADGNGFVLLSGNRIYGEEQNIIKAGYIFLCGDNRFEIEDLTGEHYIFRHRAEDVCIFGCQNIFQRDGRDGGPFGEIAGNDSAICGEEEDGIFCMFAE